MTDQELDLGLAPAQESDSAMVRAARRTIDALADAGRLTASSAILVQLLLELAEAIDKGRRSGRASAVAMAARELRETMTLLDPPPEDGDAGSRARQALADFVAMAEAAANNGGQLPTGWGQ